jgi:hypothetical protein
LNSYRLKRSGLRAIFRSFLLIALNSAILLWAAGTIVWLNAWLYIGLIVTNEVVPTSLMVTKNPKLLNERGKTIKEGTSI